MIVQDKTMPTRQRKRLLQRLQRRRRKAQGQQSTPPQESRERQMSKRAPPLRRIRSRHRRRLSTKEPQPEQPVEELMPSQVPHVGVPAATRKIHQTLTTRTHSRQTHSRQTHSRQTHNRQTHNLPDRTAIPSASVPQPRNQPPNSRQGGMRANFRISRRRLNSVRSAEATSKAGGKMLLYEQLKKKYPKISGLPRIPNNPTPAQYKTYLTMYKNSVWSRGGCKSCG